MYDGCDKNDVDTRGGNREGEEERPKLLIVRFLFELSLYFRVLARAGLGTPDLDQCHRTA